MTLYDVAWLVLIATPISMAIHTVWSDWRDRHRRQQDNQQP